MANTATQKSAAPSPPEERERHVEQRSVDDDLQPMESKVPGPVHLMDGMVHLVKAPQERHAVQGHVNAPLKEIGDDEVTQALGCEGKAREVRAAAREGEHAFEVFTREERHRTHGRPDEERVKMPVEGEIEEVVRDLAPDGPLISPGRTNALDEREEDRDGQEPMPVDHRFAPFAHRSRFKSRPHSSSNG